MILKCSHSKNGPNGEVYVMYILYNKVFRNILSGKVSCKIEYSSRSFMYINGNSYVLFVKLVIFLICLLHVNCGKNDIWINRRGLSSSIYLHEFFVAFQFILLISVKKLQKETLENMLKYRAQIPLIWMSNQITMLRY